MILEHPNYLVLFGMICRRISLKWKQKDIVVRLCFPYTNTITFQENARMIHIGLVVLVHISITNIR